MNCFVIALKNLLICHGSHKMGVNKQQKAATK